MVTTSLQSVDHTIRICIKKSGPTVQVVFTAPSKLRSEFKKRFLFFFVFLLQAQHAHTSCFMLVLYQPAVGAEACADKI